MTEALNPATLRLRGTGLIEASAGTGKTWTIAALFLRLVLGHGDALQRAQRPLVPAEILVVTFTRAATRELNDRIRQRLVQAAAVFRGQRPVPSDDTFLANLLADFAPGPERDTAAWRLESAARAMDEAAIHTLDAWCQRVLREHGFDVDVQLATEVLPDSNILREEAARDVWRQEVYPLDAQGLSAVQQLWKSPAHLAQDAQLAGEKDWPSIDPAADLSSIVADSVAELAELKRGWAQRADDMATWLLPWLQQPDTPLNKNRIDAKRAEAWLQALGDWAEDPVAEAPDLNDTARKNLTPQGLRVATKSGRSLPTPPECFDDFAVLMTSLGEYRSRAPRMRAFGTGRVLARMQQLKQQRLLHSHADVQRRLHDALDGSVHGEQALHLRKRILAQYPAALVDEFQDTSPLQLGILDRLYPIADDDPDSLLLMIGDPKQSIYAFRGADIHSYLRARQATQGRIHKLGVNYRSTQALVGAVNRLFDQAEARAGAGAFRLRAAGSLADIPFEGVKSHGLKERLVRGGLDISPLSFVLDSQAANVQDSRHRFAQRCAQAVVELLGDRDAGFEVEGKPFKRLRPADVAVLVRSHHEADIVRQAMAVRGLPSVFLSDRDSVFESDEARDLLHLVRAVAQPKDVRLARRALATRLLGFDLAALVELADDDERFEQQAERLMRLNGVWKSQGIMAMLRALLHEFDLPARWLQLPEGERRLTNVLHVGELMQAAALQHKTLAAQLRWLGQNVDEPQNSSGLGEEQVLRLESDADRVQVVTIHKSKGLEYPIVFLPFGTHVRDSSRRPPWALWLADDDGQRRLVLEPTAADLAQAELEQQREDLRLLYVALTRARFALWVGASCHSVGSSPDLVWHKSALGYLLTGPSPQEPADVERALAGFAAPLERRDPPETATGISVLDCAQDDLALQVPLRWHPIDILPPLAPPHRYAAAFDRSWSISSYSALVRGAAASSAGAFPELDETGGADDWRVGSVMRLDEPTSLETPVRLPPPATVDLPWHRFPRGAFAGNFLHGQLEWLAGENFALAQSLSLQQQLVRRCEREGWGHRADDVVRWMTAVCSTPLPALGVPLQAVTNRLSEMEFWLPSDGLNTAGLDQLCRQHIFPGQARPQLVERQLHGLLMGFADLVFEHQGRYWVLDYKSNALGPADADYSLSNMGQAVLENRYDVQAALYLLPLHRLLKARLGAAYAPERQLGGAIVFFLRGVAAAHTGCLTVQAPLALLDGLQRTLGAEPSTGRGESA